MGCRILVADDEELERRALGTILSREGPDGIEILEAANGVEAIEAASSGPLDAAFLDIKMPGIDGIEAARRILELMPGLPIVFITAHDSFEYARSALRLRVEDFLLKPASSEEVAAALSRALTRRITRRREDMGEAEGGILPQGALESAAAYVVEGIRDALTSGRVDEVGLARLSEMRGLPGGLDAVAALRILEIGEASLGADHHASLAALACLAERALSGSDRLAITGVRASPRGTLLCLLVPLGARASTADADGGCGLRESLEALVERSRADLGLQIAIGAAAPAPDTGCGGGRGEPSASACAEASLRALALAGERKPVALVYIASSQGASAIAAPDGAKGQGAASRALELMETRYAEELSLDVVSAELGLSPSHLSRLIGRQTGLGFADCLARLRIEKSKSFLETGKISVKEAAAMVGFRDPAYFARVFRRQCGMSPAEFRASGAESRASGAESRASGAGRGEAGSL